MSLTWYQSAAIKNVRALRASYVSLESRFMYQLEPFDLSYLTLRFCGRTKRDSSIASFVEAYLTHTTIYTGRPLLKETLPFAKYRCSILTHVIRSLIC
jgi:hypothetical protein